MSTTVVPLITLESVPASSIISSKTFMTSVFVHCSGGLVPVEVESVHGD